MDQRTLEALGTIIQNFSRAQGVPVKVVRAHDGRMIAFRTSQVLAYPLVLMDEGQSVRLERLSDPLALRFLTEARLNTSVVIRQSRGQMICEINLPESMFAPLALGNLRPGSGPRVAIGESVLKQQIDISLKDDRTPHLLVAGTTRSGKSVLLQTLVYQWSAQSDPRRVGLLLIDPMRRALGVFEHSAHLVHPVISENEETIRALLWVKQEIGRRKPLQTEAVQSLPRLIIVIDEISGIIAETGGADGLAARAISSIASEGAQLGIHIVVATQHPVQEFIGGAMVRANLNARLMLRVADQNASKLAGGIAGLNGHKLLGRGDCILIAGGDVQRFQVAMADPAGIARLPTTSGGRYLPLENVSIDETPTAIATPSAPAERADPLTPDQIAWSIANGIPGINTTAKALGIGNGKAQRVKEHAQALVDALDSYGCTVYREEEPDEDDS